LKKTQFMPKTEETRVGRYIKGTYQKVPESVPPTSSTLDGTAEGGEGPVAMYQRELLVVLFEITQEKKPGSKKERGSRARTLGD